MISKLLKLQLLEDDDDLVYADAGDAGDKAEAEKRGKSESREGRPIWMRTLLNSSSNWLRLLPANLQVLRRTVENIKDPLYRYFEREVNSASKLLDVVRHDLEDVAQICRGEKKQTNHHRLMISELAKGMIPGHWKKYTIPHGCTVIQWVTDFSDRVKQLQKVSSSCTSAGAGILKTLTVWLGGLFNPEAYVTATRQYVAQANGWSLEELYLEVDIADADMADLPVDECSFGVTGLKLQGAKAKNNKLHLATSIVTDLPLTNIRWVRLNTEQGVTGKITLPVYLNSTRSVLLFTVDLETSSPREEFSFYERGVAFIASTALG
jgi:dynein heavy chain 1